MSTLGPDVRETIGFWDEVTDQALREELFAPASTVLRRWTGPALVAVAVHLVIAGLLTAPTLERSAPSEQPMAINLNLSRASETRVAARSTPAANPTPQNPVAQSEQERPPPGATAPSPPAPSPPAPSIAKSRSAPSPQPTRSTPVPRPSAPPRRRPPEFLAPAPAPAALADLRRNARSQTEVDDAKPKSRAAPPNASAPYSGPQTPRPAAPPLDVASPTHTVEPTAIAAPDEPYYGKLSVWLNKHKRYPARARRRMQEGIVRLAFTIDRSGKVLNHSIEKSSGHRILDREVRALIKRASPLPPIPARLRDRNLSVVVPIAFTLH